MDLFFLPLHFSTLFFAERLINPSQRVGNNEALFPNNYATIARAETKKAQDLAKL